MVSIRDRMNSQNPEKMIPIFNEQRHIKKSLLNIRDKIQDHQRLSFEDGLSLINENSPEHINFIIRLADQIRQERVGDIVFYSSTLYLYPTNLCVFNCSFCSFYAKQKTNPNAWFYSPHELVEKLKPYLESIEEVHIVSGCHPKCDLDYYSSLFSLIKEQNPRLHIKGLTAIEYDYLTKLHNISLTTVFLTLKKAGLDSLPGGGAEILTDAVRQRISPQRISSQEFLNVHRTAHQCGIRSNITLLFNHIESPTDIISHLESVRATQDDTGGFKTLIPLKFAEHGNALGKLLRKRRHRLQIPINLLFAVSRLFLENVPNIKALWNYLGLETALNLLSCGANDLSSTHTGEKVFKMSYDGEVITMNPAGMEALIIKKGKIPCRTGS